MAGAGIFRVAKFIPALAALAVSAGTGWAQEPEPLEIVVHATPIFADPDTPHYQTDLLPLGILPVARDSYSPVTVIPRSRLLLDQPRTLGAAVADLPGVASSSYAPNGADRPIVRGLDANRVAIEENGVGIHDVSALGEDHAVPANPLVNDRIEVIRGPATLRYGSQAIGGVVNLQNNRIPQLLPNAGLIGQITSGFSSVDRGRSVAATVDAAGGNVAVHADGFRSASDDYSTPLGRQRNSAASSTGGAVGLSYIFDSGYVGVSYSHFESLYHVPGGEAADSFTRLDPKQDRVQLQGEYRFAAGPFSAVRFWLNGSNYIHHELGLDDATGIDGSRATFKSRDAELRTELQHVPVAFGSTQLTGAAGVQFGRSRLGTSGEAGGLLSPTDTRSLAGYLFEQLAFDGGFKVQAAGRIEGARAAGTATTFPADFLPDGTSLPDSQRHREFAPRSVSLGLLQELPYGFLGSLTAQYVERAPAVAELYSHGSHDAPGTFEIGDPNLKLERARSLEIGLRRSAGPLRFDASAYYTQYTGFIYRRLTGIACGEDFDSCGVETDFRQVVYSQRDARFFGAELATQYDALELAAGVLGVDGRYDFVHARFDDGTAVPRIPPHRLGGGVYWRGDGGLFARVSLLHAFTQTQTAAFETPTPGYNQLKAELSYTIPRSKTGGVGDVTFGLVGDNLLNAKIRNSTSFKKDEILLPGRGIRANLTVRF